MNGPEHFHEAEVLLTFAAEEPEASTLTAYYTDAAHVHAELAGIALMADMAAHTGNLIRGEAWEAVTK